MSLEKLLSPRRWKRSRAVIETELQRLEALNKPDDAASDVDALNGIFRRYGLAA